MNNLKQIVLAASAVCALGTVATAEASGKPAGAGAVAGTPIVVTAPTVIHGIVVAPPVKGGGGGGGGGNAAVPAPIVHGITVTQVNGKTVVTKVAAGAGL